MLQFGPVDLPLRRIAGDFDLKRLGVAEHALRLHELSIAQMQIKAVTGIVCDLQRFGCQHLAKISPRQIYVLQTDSFLLLRLRQIHIGRRRSSESWNRAAGINRLKRRHRGAKGRVIDLQSDVLRQGGENFRKRRFQPLTDTLQHVTRHTPGKSAMSPGMAGAELGLCAVQRVAQREIECLAITDQLSIKRYGWPIEPGSHIRLGPCGLHPIARSATETGVRANTLLSSRIGQSDCGAALGRLCGRGLNLGDRRKGVRRCSGQNADSNRTDPSCTNRFTPPSAERNYPKLSRLSSGSAPHDSE